LLDVSCVKAELFEHCGKRGILSHDYKTQKRFRTCDAHCLHRSGEKISSKTLTPGGHIYTERIAPTFMGIREHVPEKCSLSMVKMIIIDYLTRNDDRHAGNFGFYINSSGFIYDMLPLYDHGMCFNYGGWDISLFKWDGNLESFHKEMLEKVASTYPLELGKVLYRAERPEFATIFEEFDGIGEFAAERLDYARRIKTICDCLQANKRSRLLDS
jgi:hypothetical protein